MWKYGNGEMKLFGAGRPDRPNLHVDMESRYAGRCRGAWPRVYTCILYMYIVHYTMYSMYVCACTESHREA